MVDLLQEQIKTLLMRRRQVEKVERRITGGLWGGKHFTHKGRDYVITGIDAYLDMVELQYTRNNNPAFRTVTIGALQKMLEEAQNE